MSGVHANECEIDEALWAAYRRDDKREVTANLLYRWLAQSDLRSPLLEIPNTFHRESPAQFNRSRLRRLGNHPKEVVRSNSEVASANLPHAP